MNYPQALNDKEIRPGAEIAYATANGLLNLGRVINVYDLDGPWKIEVRGKKASKNGFLKSPSLIVVLKEADE